MNRMNILPLWIGVLAFQCVYGQLQIDNTQTPVELAQNLLAGPGVQISNVTFNGAPENAINA